MRSVFIILIILFAASANAANVNLSFVDDNKQVDGFIMYRDTMNDGDPHYELADFKGVKDAEGRVEFTDSTAEEGAIYTYRVLAYRDIGRIRSKSPFSNDCLVVVDSESVSAEIKAPRGLKEEK